MSKYSKKFKLEVVKYCVEKHHSSYDAAREFSIPSPTPIKQWIRKYKEHGIEGLFKQEKSSEMSESSSELLNGNNIEATSNFEVSDSDEALSIVPYAGNETWYYTGYLSQYVGSFTMQGNNLTPVKTIATDTRNVYLSIDTNFTCSTPSIVKVQIKEYPSGAILGEATSGVTTNGNISVIAGSLSNKMSGKKVQIYTKIYDSNGNYVSNRSCNVSYSYTLRGIGPGDLP